ncbi:MAG TPA: zinc-ribbon domain-containing protein [Collinsella ihuae]|uniref:Zinc-ribbon domain-containing protein n=1 Tax=Collinsella ihumii TaxID=1720204 RepID=A0A921IQY0_9ACTN|nr:zinc-ribbon domain-containing protein [Collinsella ihumii]
MFCQHCGARVPDDAKFCTKCGTPLRSATPQPAPQPVVTASEKVPVNPVNSYSDLTHAAPKSKAPMAALVTIAAAVFIIGIAGLVTGGFGLFDSTQVTTVEEQPADTASEAETPVEPETPVTPSSITIDLNRTSDYQELNVFITSFCELASGFNVQDHFNRDEELSVPQQQDLILFMQRHMSYNANPYLEDVDASDPMAELGYTKRVDVDYFNSLMNRYVGLTFTDQQLTTGGSEVRDGWYYYIDNEGTSYPIQNVAVVTSVTDQGNNRYEVAFDMYRPTTSRIPAEISQDTLGLPLTDMLDALGASSNVVYSGTAIVDARYDDNGNLAFTLYQMGA